MAEGIWTSQSAMLARLLEVIEVITCYDDFKLGW